MQIDFSRLRPGELISGIGGIALFCFMFLDWFGGGGSLQGNQGSLPGNFGVSAPSFDAWQSFEFTNFVLLTTAILGLKGAGLRVLGLKLNSPVSTAVLTLLAGAIASTLILWKIFDPPEDASLELGIFLGWAAAIAVGVGGYLAATEEGTEILVPIDE